MRTFATIALVTGALLLPSAAHAAVPTGKLEGSGAFTSFLRTATASCPTGARVTGLRVRADLRGYVASVSPRCDGRAIAATIGSTIHQVQELTCPPGTVVGGIYGYTGDIIDGVGLRCRGADGTSADGPKVWGGEGDQTPRAYDCPRGLPMTGLAGADVSYFGGPVLVGLKGICGRPAPRRATSCSDLLFGRPGAPDGRYRLQVEERTFDVFCRDMRAARSGKVDAPRQFLELRTNDPAGNTASYAAGGASPGTTVRTVYTAVRMNPYPVRRSPLTFALRISDRTYATSEGRLCHSTPEPCSGSDVVRSMPFGVAMACGEDTLTAYANIDLSSTPFEVVPSFTAQGAAPFGTARATTPQVVKITAGGFCGWMAPARTYNPFNDAPRGDARHGYDLRIRAMAPRS